MAFLIAPYPVYGAPGDIHDSQLNKLGLEAVGNDTMVYVYLQGIGSTVAGSVVTFNSAGLTALIAADAKGPVAVATAAVVASKFGWYIRDTGGSSGASVMMAVNSAASGNVGFETTAGSIGDDRAAGDKINGFYDAPASTTAGSYSGARFSRPYVDDSSGS